MDMHMKPETIKDLVIAIKGAGEMASGIAWRLFQSHFKYLFMMETQYPMAVRRNVSFCEAVHEETITVEGVRAKHVFDTRDFHSAWETGSIPVIVDPEWNAIKAMKPHVVIDAILAKKNLGTHLSDAPLVIGLGPGFEAGKDVHMAIETNRGHYLGRVLLTGCPEPNTGVPGNIGGFTGERVLRAPCSGVFSSDVPIGTHVKKNDVVGHVNNVPVISQIDGILRGRIRNRTNVADQVKIGDIDPRGNIDYCHTISEKARAIGGSVLEAILRKYNQ